MQDKGFFLEPAEGTRKGPEPVLSLVLPAFNESKEIESTLQNSVRFLERSNFDWELIVVGRWKHRWHGRHHSEDKPRLPTACRRPK